MWSFWRETRTLLLRYTAVAVTFVPAGIAYAFLKPGRFGAIALIGFSFMLAEATWKLIEKPPVARIERDDSQRLANRGIVPFGLDEVTVVIAILLPPSLPGRTADVQLQNLAASSQNIFGGVIR
jgi:hypothetical protein